MKSTLIMLLALVMVLALFTGCVNKGDTNADNSPDPGAAVNVEDSGMNARISGGGAASFDVPVDTQGKTLDDINDDSGASFRGSGWNMDGFVSAADQ